MALFTSTVIPRCLASLLRVDIPATSVVRHPKASVQNRQCTLAPHLFASDVAGVQNVADSNTVELSTADFYSHAGLRRC